eukprot:gene17728-biopygen17352
MRKTAPQAPPKGGRKWYSNRPHFWGRCCGMGFDSSTVYSLHFPLVSADEAYTIRGPSRGARICGAAAPSMHCARLPEAEHHRQRAPHTED